MREKTPETLNNKNKSIVNDTWRC